MLAYLVPVLVAAAGGAAVFATVRRHGWDTPSAAAAAVALAPGVGFGLLSLPFFFWIFIGSAPPGRLPLLALTVLLALALFLPVSARVSASNGSGYAWPTGGQRTAFLLLMLCVAAGLGWLLWTFPRAADAQPFGGWDAWAIWNARSLLLHRAEGELGGIFALMKEGHPDYPLLLPASLAAQYGLLGGESVAIPQVTGLLFVLGAGAALLAAGWHFGSPTAGAAAVAVLWSTPAFWRWAYTQYADIPLSYLLLVAAAGLGSQLAADERRRLPPVLAGFCLGLLAWIKNEGLVLALLLAAAFVVVRASTALPLVVARIGPARASAADVGDTLRRSPWIAAGAAPPLVALGLFKSSWSPKNETAMFLADAIDKLLDPDRWRPVLAGFFERLNPWTGIEMWGLLWLLVAVCGVVLWRRRADGGAPLLFCGFALLLIWGTWLVVYVCTPAGQVWHLNSSLNRLLLQVTPLTLAWALAGVGPREETPT